MSRVSTAASDLVELNVEREKEVRVAGGVREEMELLGVHDIRGSKTKE